MDAGWKAYALRANGLSVLVYVVKCDVKMQSVYDKSLAHKTNKIKSVHFLPNTKKKTVGRLAV